MRSKGGLESDFLTSDQWKDQNRGGQRYSSLEFEMVNGVRKARVNSISGKERNKLFVNLQGKQFEDVSLMSGTDSVADGRCFANWDYDHDGLQDIALINMNTPYVQIFRNNHQVQKGKPAGFIAVRLVGGNEYANPNSGWSNRNGYGSIVTVTAGGNSMLREKRCGEGFSSQNSSTLIVGIGDNPIADTVAVRWPNGKTQVTSNIESGSQLTIFENPEMSADGTGFELVKYQQPTESSLETVEAQPGPFDYQIQDLENDGANLRVLITMATWCESCKKHLASIARLKKSCENAKVAFYGVPIDNTDTPAKLQEYVQRHDVPYRIIGELNEYERKQAADYIKQRLGSDALPCTIVSNRAGQPLAVHFGIPTVSEIRRILAELN